MTILIHALGADMGGAVRHLTNFLPELGRHDPQREYVVLIRESFPVLDLSGNIRLERIPDAHASGWTRRLAHDVLSLPIRLKVEQFSAIVSLTNFGPIWSPVPHVFFQRNAKYYCPYYLDRIGGRQKLEIAFRRRLAVTTMMRADLIVTPSNAMADMIQEMCPETTDRAFRTIYHGFSSESLDEPLDSRFARLLAPESDVKLFYPTHPAEHKGFDVLFQILAYLRSRGLRCRLYTTICIADWPEGVRRFERNIDALGVRDNVVFMGRVPQGQMGALYSQMDLMVYPSLCESFGFSMIEALAHGLPIVAAGTKINREICCEGALYYPPLDPCAGADAIVKALQPDVSQRLRRRGGERLNSFDWSWQRYAREWVNLIRMVE